MDTIAWACECKISMPKPEAHNVADAQHNNQMIKVVIEKEYDQMSN